MGELEASNCPHQVTTSPAQPSLLDLSHLGGSLNSLGAPG
jgi:hypothetical protein